MADVTGPISTLPGTKYRLPDGSMCDSHPEVPAVIRIQGETDSFGCEMCDMCQECYDKYRNYKATEDTSGTCEWCKTHKDALKPHRDFEEGSGGRIYMVCHSCIKKENESLLAEINDCDNDFCEY